MELLEEELEEVIEDQEMDQLVVEGRVDRAVVDPRVATPATELDQARIEFQLEVKTRDMEVVGPLDGEAVQMLTGNKTI